MQKVLHRKSFSHSFGEVGNFCIVLLNVSTRTRTPIFIKICILACFSETLCIYVRDAPNSKFYYSD